MRVCPPQVQTQVVPEGYGSAATVVITQESTDPGGQIIELYARFKDNSGARIYIGKVTIQTVNNIDRRPTRVVAMVGVPGAYRYEVLVHGTPDKTYTSSIQVGCYCGDLSPYAFTPVNP